MPNGVCCLNYAQHVNVVLRYISKAINTDTIHHLHFYFDALKQVIKISRYILNKDTLCTCAASFEFCSACYQLLDVTVTAHWWDPSLTGLIIINGKRKGDSTADGWTDLPHLRFLEQQHVWGRLSQLRPQACQKGGWDLVRLGQRCPRATLVGPMRPHFTESFSPPADLYLELWLETSIPTRIFVSSSWGSNSSS